MSAKNPDFKKIYDNMVAFRNDQYLWWQVAEYTNDTFMIRARARGLNANARRDAYSPGALAPGLFLRLSRASYWIFGGPKSSGGSHRDPDFDLDRARIDRRGRCLCSA